ncbi:UDP-3-O-[3-hydroxymyristoyl] N-acetylglucosamine deacetylase [Candidatus Bealeia paramacronuclearis]|uniref:UDP-3-O-acyl-N-acetylglucosamine deacetylase n=1 Tax=Candidatus Bealeia paramacronuclearis TaxID=1921001 RepID=A0ABZ2C367_9PROT|nr:UDP-3-O-[3-hydroxymyristoyl] N-acetylglucosamine deacetylase [Candidatus Bealeia paramacronuclearis]
MSLVSSSVSIQKPAKLPFLFAVFNQKSERPEVVEKTLNKVCEIKGIGVHSGVDATLTIFPAPEGHGIIFVRSDLNDSEIKASHSSVVDTRFCTTIGNNEGATVSTIEHLMAAFSALGIDNARVEIDGPELPIMDGSAAPFIAGILKAGVKDLISSRKMIRVLRTVTAEENGRTISISPSSNFEVTLSFDFGGRLSASPQCFHYCAEETSFEKEISFARTFGLLEDAQKMWAAGLSKGASLENTLVFDQGQVMNEEGLRYEDECVRHKILDVIGDLHLAGGKLLGHVKADSTGHGLNHKLLLALFSDPQNYRIENA